MKYNNWTAILSSMNSFQEHMRSNLVYPAAPDINSRLITVPLDVVISPEGTLESVSYADRTKPPTGKYHYTREDEFVVNALDLVKSFESWVPKKQGQVSLRTHHVLLVNYFYHKAVFENHDIILNPDTRPIYPRRNVAYECAVECKLGCDGLGELLLIIDEKGVPQDIECISAQGKTNCQFLILTFLKLGSWKAATHKGLPVKAQMSLTVYT